MFSSDNEQERRDGSDYAADTEALSSARKSQRGGENTTSTASVAPSRGTRKRAADALHWNVPKRNRRKRNRSHKQQQKEQQQWLVDTYYLQYHLFHQKRREMERSKFPLIVPARKVVSPVHKDIDTRSVSHLTSSQYQKVLEESQNTPKQDIIQQNTQPKPIGLTKQADRLNIIKVPTPRQVSSSSELTVDGKRLLLSSKTLQLEDALGFSPQARVVVEAQTPYRIVHANAAYANHLQNKEIVGTPLNPSPSTPKTILQTLASHPLLYRGLVIYPIFSNLPTSCWYYRSGGGVNKLNDLGNEEGQQPTYYLIQAERTAGPFRAVG